jgi:hypothetical protein
METDNAQRAILDLLLDRHPVMLTVGELRTALPGVGAGVEEALVHLQADGLANRLGIKVGASRAAVRAAELVR